MRAAVLAGGLGTRLHPYTTILPKALVPVSGRPILERIFEWLARGGIERVDVCVGHLGELIQTYFSQSQTVPEGLDLHWRWEHEPLGTIGPLRNIEDLDESLLVVNGDVLTDLEPATMLTFHREQRAALTIATRRANVETDLGVVEHEAEIVVGFREKPVVTYTASMGVYICEPRALAALPKGPCQFPDLVVDLLGRNERVIAYLSDSEWSHVGTFEQHTLADERHRQTPSS